MCKVCLSVIYISSTGNEFTELNIALVSSTVAKLQAKYLGGAEWKTTQTEFRFLLVDVARGGRSLGGHFCAQEAPRYAQVHHSHPRHMGHIVLRGRPVHLLLGSEWEFCLSGGM